MTDLKTTTKIVKAILEQDERTRNSDSFLYLRVVELYAQRNGINLLRVTVPTFLQHLGDMGFPPFESVRRTRQKIQQHHPELCASDKVDAMRSLNEEVYRDYARRLEV